ncbi:MAG: alpha/beta hydrolase, partial [Bacteroidota bacterium]
ITFDNRGIGDSVKGSINKCGATLENWGRLDMAGALERLKTEFPAVTYHLIGNSAGGQLMGLMPNYKDLSSIFNVSCSSGSISNNTFLFSLQAHFFLSFYIPLNNLIFGNSNSHWVGMGEPLPKKIGADWGRYCRGRGYVEQDLGTRIKEHWYGEISVPSLWLWATDDKIANLANVKDMIRVMPKLDAKIEALDPKELGIKGGIGHMGFFRRKCQGLWVKAVEWLEGNMG